MNKLAACLLCLMAATASRAADMVASLSVQPPSSPSGSLLTVTLLVANPNAGQVDAVTPALLHSGAASAVLAWGPVPASQSIAGGNGNGTFTWVYSTSGCGSLSFSGGASGTDAGGTVNSNWHAASPVSAQCTPSPTPTASPSFTPSPTATETPWIVYVTRVVPEQGEASIPGNVFHPLHGRPLALRYALPHDGRLSISIHNRLGQLIRRIEKDAPAGSGSESWDGRTDNGSFAGTGIYIAHFRSKGLNKAVKFVIVK